MDKVTHFEIPADNVKRAIEFYKNIFEWKTKKVPGMDYWMTNTVAIDKNNMPLESGAINGGFVKKEHKEETPVVVISVDFMEKQLRKIKKFGGIRIMPIQKVGNIGFYTRFRDTEGNIIGLWQDMNNSDNNLK